MTRSEAIAVIVASLPRLDDASVSDLAELVQSSMQETDPPLSVSEETRAAIQRSKEDFKAGRVVLPNEYKLRMDAFMADLEAKYPTSE